MMMCLELGWNEADLSECSTDFIEEMVRAFERRARDNKK